MHSSRTSIGHFDWNWAAAEIRSTSGHWPSIRRHLAALQRRGMLSYTLGRCDDAERQFRAALVRDPLNPYVIWNLGINYYLAGRIDEGPKRLPAVARIETGLPVEVAHISARHW